MKDDPIRTIFLLPILCVILLPEYLVAVVVTRLTMWSAAGLPCQLIIDK